LAPERLRVGVVGLGVGEQHARAYARLPGCELRAVADLDEGRARALAAELGARAATRFDELLDDPELDLLSIASYDDHHFEQVVAALQAGKHVFVEKPLCRTVAEAREVKHALRGSGTKMSSNLVLRSAPFYGWLHDEARSGRLGRLYAFDGDYLYGRLHKITDGWRREVDHYSVVLGGGIHLVDLMIWIVGDRPATVSAAGNRISTQQTSFRYDDFVAATFVFSSGLVGRITANFAGVHAHQHVVRVFGTEATVLYDDAGPRLHASRDPAVAPEPVELAALPATKGELIPAFVQAILGGRDPVPSAQHELDVISVCAATDRALAEGGTVDIEYA
jgi:predicted dehydrogenase